MSKETILYLVDLLYYGGIAFMILWMVGWGAFFAFTAFRDWRKRVKAEEAEGVLLRRKSPEEHDTFIATWKGDPRIQTFRVFDPNDPSELLSLVEMGKRIPRVGTVSGFRTLNVFPDHDGTGKVTMQVERSFKPYNAKADIRRRWAAFRRSPHLV